MNVANITEAAISQGLKLGDHDPAIAAGLVLAAERNRSPRLFIGLVLTARRPAAKVGFP